MRKRVGHLVVDSGAFIKNSPIHDYSDQIYTVEDAVKEIKDKATLQRLQVLPYELKQRTPTKESYKYVAEFAKKTGDYGSLSATDLQIIALTYELAKEHLGIEHLNKEPSCQITGQRPTGIQPLEGFYYPKKGEEEDEDNEGVHEDEGFSEKSSSISEDSSIFIEALSAHERLQSDEVNPDGSAERRETEAPEDDDELTRSDVHTENNDDEDINGLDDEAWITPHNLSEVQKKMGNMALDDSADVAVACVTTDFAVQNVLLQMGLHVVSVDGMLIRQIRVFVLRCFGCFKVTADTTKQFCPNCGNKTLKRVSVSVADDGTKNIHINFKRPIKIRGTKYSLTMPRGGKHAQNPHVVEDQPFPQNRPSKATLKKIDVFSPDYVTNSSPFAMRDVYSRAAGLGIYGLKQKQSRRNPNEWSVRSGNKKKSKK